MTTPLALLPNAAPGGITPPPRGLRLEAVGATKVLRDGSRLLTDVNLRIEPGELVAVIGASGAGKSTLLETLAGLRLASTGTVSLGGLDSRAHRGALRTSIGYVPQDDIIHRSLSVRATLSFAARLRLPRSEPHELAALVDRTMAQVGLADRASTTVAALSGGQRKRVSIAVELLTRPGAFFLDEPTSGLDPGTARDLMATLRELSSSGSTVVLTTHSPDDVTACDRVVVLAKGGRVAFDGPPAGALAHFGVRRIADIYRSVESAHAEQAGSEQARREPAMDPATEAVEPARPAARSPRAGQWSVLSRRNLAVLSRQRLTLAIMLGAPALVIAMFVVLFRPGAFDALDGDPLAAVGITYWLAFAAFFFGLTYGLLQVSTEIAIVRREHHVGVGIGAYLAAKVVVLLPVLIGVNVAMLAVLWSTDRLPWVGWSGAAVLLGLLLLDAAVALALGLLASAAVADPLQATLALPMLCFPAVLFGGAVLPVRAMAPVGQAISTLTSDRWAFEALGRILDLDTRFVAATDAPVVVHQHGAAFGGGVVAHAAGLLVFAVAFGWAAVRLLRGRMALGR